MEGDATFSPRGLTSGDFNPRPPWGGRRHCPPLCLCVYRHFNPRPPWGGRQAHSTQGQETGTISIHALRGEGDTMKNCIFGSKRVFQSTPSVGRATTTQSSAMLAPRDFNPRPPWGGRRSVFVIIVGDRSFQSTPSVGRATKIMRTTSGGGIISIHALRGEGDARCRLRWCMCEYFNPRPPWGGRRHRPRRLLYR